MIINRLYPYALTIFGADQKPSIQVNYDSEGLIGVIFTHNPIMDAMVKADIESFPERHPEAFALLSLRIRAELMDMNPEEVA